MTAIYVEIISTKGSAPRDAGTAMRVTAFDTQGTIGGGALEHQAIAKARHILEAGGPEQTQSLPLGPGLGQCCGGAVVLNYTYDVRQIDDVRTRAYPKVPICGKPILLWLWGAGHVGRAVARAAHPHAFDITWVDSATDRFPDMIPEHITPVSASDMPRLALRAPSEAHHLIFTYAHDIDLALCAALLRRGASNIGLIGSATKWARFRRRLSALGLDPETITCPIGDTSLGKEPDAIALGTLRALVAQAQQRVSA